MSDIKWAVDSPLNGQNRICNKLCVFMIWNNTSWLCYRAVTSLTHWGRDKMAATLADDTFKRKFVKENILISIQISLKFVSKGPINNMPALVQIMAWRRPCDKPLSEPMMIISLTHICVTRPQWVNHRLMVNDGTLQNTSETSRRLS